MMFKNKEKLIRVTTADHLTTRGYKNTYFYAACFGLFYIFYILFYFQATANLSAIETPYISDLPSHIEFAKTLFIDRKISYPLFHIYIFILNRLPVINLYTGSALVLATSCIATILLIRWAFRKSWGGNEHLYLIDVLSVSLVFVFNLYIPSYSNYIYLFIGGFNIWHNPTYLLMKPLAVLSFFAFIIAYDKYSRKEKYVRYIIAFAVITVICTLAKPSYAFVFLPALAIFLLCELVCVRTKSIKFCAWVALSIIPVVVLMYFQSRITFNPKNAGIIFKFGGEWSNSIKNVIIPILLVNAFSIFVFVFGGFKRIISDKKYLLAALSALVGCMQFYLLAETGLQAGAGNFAWGYYIGAFLFFMISTYNFIFEMKMKPTLRNVGTCIFTLQLATGIYYFVNILFGRLYF